MIYADFNATTPLSGAVRAALQEGLEVWGNPSSAHQIGRSSLAKIESCREKIALALEVKPHEVIFTSGGSEANNLALVGMALEKGSGLRILTTKVEHSSINDSYAFLKSLGAEIQFFDVSESGEIDLATFEKVLSTYSPHLVSTMAANNETGLIFPVAEMARLSKAAGALFHTDAVQAFGKLPTSFFSGADMFSVTAHKIYGPKGIGALVLKNGVKLKATHFGGSQEIKRRGGTENLLGILGFAAAIDGAMDLTFWKGFQTIKDRFEKSLLEELEGVCITNSKGPRLANTTNIRFSGIASQILLTALDLEGICLSAGSACSSGSISPSHVLLSMGLPPGEAKEALRISFGRTTTSLEVDTLRDRMVFHVKRIRARKRS